ncbi:unnamed protein product [Heligmosomoides polygyrus]|uniref:C2H2-type domain-containing protein n=1 Tax=Heligmosomoides polygyrus TaxID=6339 RepID=A0A183F8K3_HELPZ|nr:unnamed protein product [Heligmosomoides polygyrus]
MERQISVDVIDLLTGDFEFLPDLTDRCGRHAGIMADGMLHVRYSSTAGLMLHLERCRCEYRVEKADRVGKDNEFEYSMDGQVQATNPKQLPTRPLTFPPLPDQMGESDKGSVLCPVPRCKGRFTNHDSLSYHCLVEHSELGAAGTPQDFSIRQYRFENKEELKDWLYDKCEQTCTSFATKTSMWSGYAMYRCNRAGTFKTSGTIRPGCSSKKAQTHCSAFLRPVIRKSQDFSIRQYRFENKEELKDWLYDKCEQTCTSFATKTSMWSGYAMYRCNRAGTFKTSGTIRPGCSSKKAQTHCSAFLRVRPCNSDKIR